MNVHIMNNEGSSYLAHMGEHRITYKSFVRKPEGKHTHKSRPNIKNRLYRKFVGEFFSPKTNSIGGMFWKRNSAFWFHSTQTFCTLERLSCSQEQHSVQLIRWKPYKKFSFLNTATLALCRDGIAQYGN
jgi:hypothetical protein